jgi:hypothetical protein
MLQQPHVAGRGQILTDELTTVRPAPTGSPLCTESASLAQEGSSVREGNRRRRA